jgi:hypothetical protein
MNVYRTFIQRNPVFLTTIFASAFAFEMYVIPRCRKCKHILFREEPMLMQLLVEYSAFDTTSNKVWDTLNRGVRTPESFVFTG